MHAMRAIACEVKNKINWVQKRLYILFSQKTDVYFKYPTFPPFFIQVKQLVISLFFFSFIPFSIFWCPHVLPYIIEFRYMPMGGYIIEPKTDIG